MTTLTMIPPDFPDRLDLIPKVAPANPKMRQAKGMEKSYIPTVTTGVAYQQLDDPTSYGNNC